MRLHRSSACPFQYYRPPHITSPQLFAKLLSENMLWGENFFFFSKKSPSLVVMPKNYCLKFSSIMKW